MLIVKVETETVLMASCFIACDLVFQKALVFRCMFMCL